MKFKLKDIREMANRLGLWEKVFDRDHYFFLPKGLVEDLEEGEDEDEREDLFSFESGTNDIHCYKNLEMRYDSNGKLTVIYDDSERYYTMKDLERACKRILIQARIFRETVKKIESEMRVLGIEDDF